MEKEKVHFWTILLLFNVVVSYVHGQSSQTQVLVEGNGDFALDMYKLLSDKLDGGNIFFSPFSISSALGMTYAGAKSNTKDQMAEVLGFEKLQSDVSVHASFNELFDLLSEPTNNYTLNVANRLFGAQGYEWLEAFLETVSSNYAAALEQLNFADNAEGSRTHINDWVADKTKDKIKDLLKPGTISGSTVMVLVNAIYFKGLWRFPFNPDATRKQPFHLSASDSVQMDMMTLNQMEFKYYEHAEWDCKILELSYEGNKASMVVLLPNQQTGLSTLEDKLTIDDLNTALGNLQYTDIQAVTIPKFKITQGMSLKAFLSLLGMSDLFDAGLADLSGMNGAGGLVVTEVVHKAFVDVNEQGTEAAGATGVVTGVSAPMNPKIFVADRPFIFFIRDQKTNTILFLGRLAKPPGDNDSIGSFGSDDVKDNMPPPGTASKRYLDIRLLTMVCLFLLFWKL